MQNLRILHISDLHYSNTNKNEIEYIKNAILHDIDSFIIKSILLPNFIIFSGDLVFKPDNDISSIQVLEEAYKFFIEPLLKKLSLTKDDVFITSGNHDINRSILTRGNKNGLLSYLEDKKTSNELIDEIINKRIDITHMKQFNNFINSLKNSHEVYANDIFRVYKKTIGKIEIGIINLNSNILSFDDKSYGNLLIGEEQLKSAYKYIEDCDIKIANIHHSINWLVWFEQQLVKKFYYKNFNLVFIGHEHMEQPELVNFNDEDTLIVNSASIFQGRNNTNGYSLLDYSFSDKSIDIYVREYDDREAKFRTVTFQEDSNKYKYYFNILEKSKNKKNIELILDEIRTPLRKLIKEELLINTAKNESNEIEDIFVEPNIYTESEFLDKDKDKELYTINKIIYAKKPIVINGIESSGKTTILNFLANEYLNMKASDLKIPILLNYFDINDVITDAVIFAKAIDYFKKLQFNISRREIEQLVRDGNLVFLIDNIIEKETIEKFISSKIFKDNQFIFTIKEEIFNSIKDVNNQIQSKNDNIIDLYLYNLKREKAKEFFSLYFKNDNFEINDFEGIYKFITKLNIPLTVFNYTLIAHVYDNQRSNFKLVNEAYLLDIFMENLLEKLDIVKNIHIGSLGYNLKSSYLVYVSKWMVNNNIFIVDKYKLQEITIKFIQELKREKEGIQIDLLIDYMEQKGIFVNTESNLYRFRYKTFLEFFIAKGMEKDNVLKEKIINKDTYLKYKNEIRYYSGLHGEDEKLIEHFNTMLFSHNEYFNNIQINDGNTIYIPELSLKEDEKISVEQINEETKDKLVEVKSTNMKNHNTNMLKDKIDNDESIDKIIFQTNNLLSNILRNSEQLRNPKLKVESLKLVTKNLSKFFQKHLNESQEIENELISIINSEVNDEHPTIENIKEFISLMNIISSQAFMHLAYNNIASDSLFTIYNEILEETNDNVLKLIITSTFIYSENYKAIKLIEILIKDKEFSKNKFLMMSLFLKIHHAIKIRDIDNKYKSKLENFLTEIMTTINSTNIVGKGATKKMRIESNKQKIKEHITKSLS